MLRHLAFLFMFLAPLVVVSADAPQPADACSRPGPEVEVENTLFFAGAFSSLALALASGHVAEAKDEIELTIASSILQLNAHLNPGPCSASEAVKARIYPMLRVIAAANNRAPISHVNDDKRITDILQKAIADNPAHYGQLLKRSEHWDAGIK